MFIGKRPAGFGNDTRIFKGEIMMIRLIVPFLGYLLKGDRRYVYYFRLRSNLRLSKDEIHELQARKLRQMIRYVHTHVPFYRDYFFKNKIDPEDIKTPRDLVLLPILTKQIIKDNLKNLKSDIQRDFVKVTSGGSTGETSVVFKSPYFIQMSRATTLRNMAIAGWYPYDKSVWIWGAPYEHQQIADSLLARIGTYVNGRLMLNAYNYSPKFFPNWTRKIMSFKPKILYGYASIILEYAKWCYLNGVSFDSIKSVVSTTEKLADRKLIEDAFKCKVYDQYGSREVLSIATECKCGNLHVSDDTAIVQQTQENELIITALDSFHFPLIRFKIGDIGKLQESKCLCGLNFSTMGLDIGRVTDNFIRPNGQKISGSALATYISTLDLAFNKYQLIQKDIHLFEAVIVGDQEVLEHSKGKFINALEEYFGQISVNFTLVKELPVEPSGKRLLFKCLIKVNESTSSK